MEPTRDELALMRWIRNTPDASTGQLRRRDRTTLGQLLHVGYAVEDRDIILLTHDGIDVLNSVPAAPASSGHRRSVSLILLAAGAAVAVFWCAVSVPLVLVVSGVIAIYTVARPRR